jgi:hypothetical protein
MGCVHGQLDRERCCQHGQGCKGRSRSWYRPASASPLRHYLSWFIRTGSKISAFTPWLRPAKLSTHGPVSIMVRQTSHVLHSEILGQRVAPAVGAADQRSVSAVSQRSVSANARSAGTPAAARRAGCAVQERVPRLGRVATVTSDRSRAQNPLSAALHSGPRPPK